MLFITVVESYFVFGCGCWWWWWWWFLRTEEMSTQKEGYIVTTFSVSEMVYGGMVW
jgi:hypothetical protein